MIEDGNMDKDISVMREATRRFYSGEMSVKEYKSVSGGFGRYAQKGAEKSMVRLRLAGGSIDKDKLAFICDCIRKYDIDMVHLTTCQAMQFHDLDGDAACDIIEGAFDHGIITLGGGGDNPRNVTASPLSGVEPGEMFDVLPYARAVERYVMSIYGTFRMPRKLKIGFSNSPENETHATFRDLGFVAKWNGTFDVYSAGGLGNNPRMGVCVYRDAPPGKVLYFVDAMIRNFILHGNYENRTKARTRYMQETLGTDGYVTAFNGELSASLARGGLDISVGSDTTVKRGNGTVEMPRVHRQEQDGLYYVAYHPIGGDPAPSKVLEIEETIRDMDGVEIRLSPDETMYIINCDADEAARVAAVTDDGARTLFESSVSCVGNTICQIGLRDSRGLLEDLIGMSRRNGFADGVLPRVRISGCVSSCGNHQIGVIGFQGMSKKVDGVSRPAFNVFLNGSHIRGEERFGDPIGSMTAEDIPCFLEDIGRAVSAEGTDYRAWSSENRDRILSIAERYTSIGPE